MTKREQHKPEFKARVALEALKGEQRASELARRFSMHPTMTHQWKKALLEGASELFERDRVTSDPKAGVRPDQGPARQDRRVDGGTGFFSRQAGSASRQERKAMIQPDHPKLSIMRQCRLASISRSTFYHAPKGGVAISTTSLSNACGGRSNTSASTRTPSPAARGRCWG